MLQMSKRWREISYNSTISDLANLLSRTYNTKLQENSKFLSPMSLLLQLALQSSLAWLVSKSCISSPVSKFILVETVSNSELSSDKF